MTVTCTASSVSAASSAANSSARIPLLIALRFSGRLSVTRRTPGAASSTTMNSSVTARASAGRAGSGELGQELDRVVLVGVDRETRDAALRPRDEPFRDPLARTDQCAFVDVLVGDGGDRLIAAAGEEQLLDALGRFGVAA